MEPVYRRRLAAYGYRGCQQLMKNSQREKKVFKVYRCIGHELKDIKFDLKTL